jgi:hypothetical protein
VAALGVAQDRLQTSYKVLSRNPRDRGTTRQDSRPASKTAGQAADPPPRVDPAHTACWYHRRFGWRAQNCTPTCSFRQQGN